MKLKRWMCLLAVLFMFAAMTAQADTVSSALLSNAETAEEQAQFPFLAETNELAVNVRKETSTKSAKVGRLERGTQLTVLGAQLSGSGEVWYAVELKDGTQGFIRSDLLVRSEQQMPVTLAVYSPDAVLGAQQAAKQTFKAKITQNAVNVRKDASTSSGKTGKVARGEILTVLSQVVNSADETWYAVELKDGTKGYIRSDLLIEADEEDIVQASYQGTTKSAASSEKKSSGSGSYIGNKNTKKFHRKSCRTLPAPKNQVKLSSREKAISSGYVPCKNCDP